jgi:hypothetical protein
MRVVTWFGVALVTVVMLFAFVPSIAHGGSTPRASASVSFHSKGSLDCNGDSAIQAPLVHDLTCTHPRGSGGNVFEDNNQYVGHDEPTIRYISTQAGSGNDVEFTTVLPGSSTGPISHPTFQDTIAFWYGMALCDNRSYPQQTCINNSDTNTGLGTLATDAGSAALEMQFYPPGFGNFANAVSCDATHWCASLHINSLECTFSGFCNPNCTEPTNFAFLTVNGVPIGPPGPNTITLASFNGANPNVFHMNMGDKIVSSIHDTPVGLFTGIQDLTTHTSGYMVASAAHGFQSLDVATCLGHNYAFHPEYDSAAAVNIVPWTALQFNIGMDPETGHFEVPSLLAAPDETYCLPGPSGKTVCLSTDFNFDGNPYQPNQWPTTNHATSVHPAPLNIMPTFSHHTGPESKGHYYSIFEFETDVGFTIATQTTCNLLLPNQCGLPNATAIPTYAGFYPYWSTMGCTVYFGNVHGPGVSTYGKDAGYGVSQAVFSGLTAIYGTNGAFYANSC